MRDYLRKGSQIFIEGSLRTNKWQDKNGQDRYTTEVIASNMQMLDRKGESMGGGDSGFGGAASQPSGQMGGGQSMPEAGSEFQQVQLTEDDDIPF